MKQPPTLVIEHDEERTVVDPRKEDLARESEVTAPFVDPVRPASSAPAFEGSEHALPPARTMSPTKRREQADRSRSRLVAVRVAARWRILLRSVFLFGLFGALLVIAYRERQVADTLRETIYELSRNQHEILERFVAAPVSGSDDQAILARQPTSSNLAEALDRELLELRAAELLIANDYSEALAQYRNLAMLFPNETVFGDFVAVLEWKLRCGDSGKPANSECR